MSNGNKLKSYLRDLREQRRKKYGIEGLIVSFDGMSSSGKTVQTQKLVSELERAGVGITRIRETNEGRDIAEGESRRRISYRDSVISGIEEDPDITLELYNAERKIVWREVILDRVKDGRIVVVDRSSYSTLAMQIQSRGLGADSCGVLELAERIFQEPIIPSDLAIFTMCEPSIAYDRAKDRKRESPVDASEVIDPWYRAAYRARYRVLGKEEDMLRWWFGVTGRLFRYVSRVVPDSEAVTTGRHSEQILNPKIYTAVTKLAERIGLMYDPNNGREKKSASR